MNEPTSILIVEDSSVQALRLRRALEQQGWQTAVVGNGLEALAFLRERRPALVISDIFMPEMNGYEMCRAIKEDEGLRAIPVLLLITVADMEDILLVLHACADDFLAKPYKNEELFATVRALIAAVPMTARDVAPEEPIPVRLLSGNTHDVVANRPLLLRLLLATYRQNMAQSRALASAENELRELRQQAPQNSSAAR